MLAKVVLQLANHELRILITMPNISKRVGRAKTPIQASGGTLWQPPPTLSLIVSLI